MGGLIILAGFVCALLYLPLQVVTSLYARGGTRVASLVPVPVAAFVAIITVSALIQRSNLWPICVIFCSPAAVVFLLGCMVAESHSRQIDPFRAETQRQRRRRMGLCETCAYDLKGNVDGGCPECGWRREGQTAE